MQSSPQSFKVKSIFFAFLLFAINSINAQVVGSRSNSDLIPTKVEPTQLTGGGYSGDVNVFNGSYNSSYPLGTVSTPGGLSWSVNLNYSSSYSEGQSPSICSGIPYGEGWSVDLPMITVSNAAYFAFLSQYECAIDNLGHSMVPDTNYYASLDTINGLNFSTPEVHGDVFWFSPKVNVPGVASGRAIFKYIDQDDANCAVFVMNKFEKFCELRFYGDRWILTDDSGNKYYFATTLVTYRSPNNQRVLSYDESSPINYNQVADVIEASDYGNHKDAVLNVTEPKRAFTSWYCDLISNKNLPSQNIQFEYEKFGAFNYFQEFEQPLIESQINNELREFPLFLDYTAYTDIFLKEVSSNVHTSPFEILSLDYELLESGQIPQPLLDPRDSGVDRLDSLYSFTTVYTQGIGNDFEDWRRYYHGRSSGAININGGASTKAWNPYLSENTSEGDGYIAEDLPDEDQLRFKHGFLESPRILTDNMTMVSGDIYEVRTKISDNNGASDAMGNGTVDINIATGDLNFQFPSITCSDPQTIVCDTNDLVLPYDSIICDCGAGYVWNDWSVDNYSSLNNLSNGVLTDEKYNATRGGSVFSTFNQAIKWNLASNDNSINTSNFFVMPNVPEFNDGVNIQIGPGNADMDYTTGTSATDGVRESADNPSAYKAYEHLDPNSGAYHLYSYQNIPHNFGIGLPWTQVEPLYIDLMGGPVVNNPQQAQAYDFWWNWDTLFTGTMWPNEPTKFNEQVFLQEVELIRYSKSPYMLKSAKLYRVNGEINFPNDSSGLILVSHQEIEYGWLKDTITQNLNYRLGQSDTLFLSTQFQYVYTLDKIKNIPVAGWQDDPSVRDNFIDDEILQTEFEYEVFGPVFSWSDFDVIGNPGSKGRVMTKVIDQLGGETRIEYYPYESSATLKESSYVPRFDCAKNNDPDPVIPPSGARDIHPSVHFITRLDENNNLTNTSAPNPLKRWEYVYDTTQIVFQTIDYGLTNKFRNGYKRSYSKGFKTTTLIEPALATGEQPYTVYEHIGNVITGPLDNPTIEEYLFFGKPEKITLYNDAGEKEEETEFFYDHTQAYLNGYERPNLNRNNLNNPLDYNQFENAVHARNYEYGDYYKDETTSYTGIIGYAVIFDDGNPGTNQTVFNINEGDTLFYYYNSGVYDVLEPFYSFIPIDEWLEVNVTGAISYGALVKAHIIETGYLGNSWGNSLEKSRFLETYFYDDLKNISSNPEFYFHSYFCKTGKVENRTYDDGCTKGTTFNPGGIPDDYAVQDEPFGGSYTNPVNHIGPQEVVEDLINNETGNGTGIQDALIENSPLSEVNIGLVIQKSGQFKSSVIRNVLLEQPALSDAILGSLMNASSKLKQGHVVSILEHQPYLSDAFQLSVVNRGNIYPDKVFKTVYTSNPHLSDKVMISTITAPTFSSTLLKKILLDQGQLSEPVLNTLVDAEHRVDGFVVTKVLLNQDILTDHIFQSMLSHPTITTNDVVKVYSRSNNYPEDGTLQLLLADTNFTDKQYSKVFLAANRAFDNDFSDQIILNLPPNHIEIFLETQLNANPYGQYCNNEPDLDREFIETVTEYQYYEANYDGRTLCEGYKKLLGLEDVPGRIVSHPDYNNGIADTLETIVLKHEPSWQLHRTKTYSPNYPNAFSADEYYYYFDLQNRYSRHFQFYDLESGNYFRDNGYIINNDTLVFCTTWPADHQLSGGKEGHIPLTDGAKNSQKNEVRNIAFQKTTFSRNNVDTDSLMRSEYYFYDSRWNENTIYTDSSRTYNGPSCPGDPEDCDDDEYECAGCIFLKFNGSQEELENQLPFGYCLNFVNGNDFWACPSGVNLLDYGAVSVDITSCYPDEGDPEDGDGTRAIDQAGALDNAFYLKDVVVQIDTISSTDNDWVQNRTDQSNYYIMDFRLGEPTETDSLNRRISFANYPYDTLAVRTITERNEYTQVQLERNATGVYTRYYYNTPIRIWNVNANNGSCLGFGNYSSIYTNDIGMPNRITVGFGRFDSLSTTYTYHPNYAIDSIVNPTGYKMRYEYDDYDRLKYTFENDRLLSSNAYEYWNRNQSLDFLDRTNENYVETYLYNGPIVGNQYEGEHIRAFVDPLGRNYSTTTNIDGDSTQVHSGTLVYDNWSRVVKAHKPYELLNQADLNRTENTAPAFTQNAYENDHKSRVLRNAKYGITDINDVHTVKQRYKIINKVVLGCELDLSAYETNLLINQGYTGDVKFTRVEIEDEDEKVKIEYFNALGQKVGTKQYGDHTGDEIITLYTYDSYGNLTKVINPEKQESDYEYNILGQLFRETTVDAGEHKFMYNKLGLVTVEHDAHARVGEPAFNGATENTSYYRVYEYDDYGRLLVQEKKFFDAFPIGVFYPKDFDILFYKDTLNGVDGFGQPIINNSGFEQEYFDYHFSNISTYDWMANIDMVVEGIMGNPQLGNEMAVDLLEATSTKEKEFVYGLSTVTNTRGKIQIAYSFNLAGEYIQTCNYTYDEEERLLTEITEFNPSGKFTPSNPYNDPSKTVITKISYPEYNYRGSLLTQNVDVHNDGILDFQYCYVYDDWNRLREVYANYVDVKDGGNLIARYDYNDALGLLTVTEHIDDSEYDCPDTAAQTITYTYDVRDRLTNMTSSLFDYSLYYDNNNPPADINGEMVNNHKNWNGNINGIKAAYNLDGSYITNPSGPAGLFDLPTIYGYKYDDINRLFKADAIVGDLIDTSMLSYDIGDVKYNFDKIGNLKNLTRTTGVDINGLVLEEWNYKYFAGTNRLKKAKGQGTTVDRNYTYDANGNLATDDFRELNEVIYARATYPYHISKPTLEIDYLYDQGDMRIYKYSASPADTTEEYYLKNLGILDMQTNNWTWYVNGVQRVAKITPRTFQQPDSITIQNGLINNQNLVDEQFYLYDHLGNTRVLYTPDRRPNCQFEITVNYAADYYPYGKILREFSNGPIEKFLTTQHERDQETGLDYRGARFYDSDIGRFLSLDPNASNYPNYNDYCYVMGNPVILVDMNGLDPILPNWAEWVVAAYNPMVFSMKLNEAYGLSIDKETWMGQFTDQIYKVVSGEAMAESIVGLGTTYIENPELLLGDLYFPGTSISTLTAYGMGETLNKAFTEGDPRAWADIAIIVATLGPNLKPKGGVAVEEANLVENISSESVIESSQRITKGTTGRGVQALSKKIDRNNPAYSGLKANQATVESIINSVLEAKNQVIRPVTNGQGVKMIDIYNTSTNQGIRINSETVNFDTFINYNPN